MLKLNLPDSELKTTERDGIIYVWDNLRNKYVKLTPEEEVRQRFVSLLIKEKSYPRGLMMNEVAITLNGTSKRCDSVLYDRNLTPVMIIEYKAPCVEITKAVFEQIYRYNIVLKVKYLMVSNGIKHYCCRIDYDSNKCIFLNHIPEYGELL